MNLSIPFLISDGPRAFKFFKTDGRSDPLDVNAVVAAGPFTLQVESERPECLEVELEHFSALEVYDGNRPAGRLIPLSPGGPFRVSAQLIGPTGEAIAAGGFLAFVCNDVSELPQGDLALALAPPPMEASFGSIVLTG